MAEVVIKSSKNLGIAAKAKKIKNPRKEMEEHYYNPKNTSLISLGLNPILFDEKTIEKDLKLITKYKKSINQEYFMPTVKWEI